MNRSARRREVKRRSKMKYIENSPLIGRKGTALDIGKEKEVLTPLIFIVETLNAGLPGDKNTNANQRKVNAILDYIEPQVEDQAKAALEAEQAQRDAPVVFVELGDTDWDFLRPTLDIASALTFQRHGPFIMDELDARINRGKGEEPPPVTEGQDGHTEDAAMALEQTEEVAAPA